MAIKVTQDKYFFLFLAYFDNLLLHIDLSIKGWVASITPVLFLFCHANRFSYPNYKFIVSGESFFLEFANSYKFNPNKLGIKASLFISRNLLESSGEIS